MNPFTRLQSSPNMLLTGNRRGVQSRTDRINTTLSVVGDVAIDGRVHTHESIADNFFKTSDRRLKQKISNLDLKKSIDIIKKLQPVTFKYKNQDSTKANVGYIAQDAECVDSSLVNINTNGYYSLNYNDVSVHTTNILRYILQQISE